MCIGSSIVRWTPSCDEMFSIWFTSVVVLSRLNQLIDFTLKSPRTGLKKGFSALVSQDLIQSYLKISQTVPLID